MVRLAGIGSLVCDSHHSRKVWGVSVLAAFAGWVPIVVILAVIPVVILASAKLAMLNLVAHRLMALKGAPMMLFFLCCCELFVVRCNG